MPRLTKIYTRTGDDGTTALGDGTRVAKCDLRVEAYGCVDEASAAIGFAVACAGEGETEAQVADVLRGIQNDLLDLGGDLCMPVDGGRTDDLRITPEQVDAIEGLIDRFNRPLTPLKNFILPGGTPMAAGLHLARTITRRAERTVVELSARDGPAVNPQVVRYLNRLSDLLFVLARVANGGRDVLWRPGASRSE